MWTKLILLSLLSSNYISILLYTRNIGFLVVLIWEGDEMIEVKRSKGRMNWEVLYNGMVLEVCQTKRKANEFKEHYQAIVGVLVWEGSLMTYCQTGHGLP